MLDFSPKRLFATAFGGKKVLFHTSAVGGQCSVAARNIKSNVMNGNGIDMKYV